MEFAAYGATHQGLIRPGNEDAYLCGRRVFAVADGLGGHVAGEVAAALALGPLEALDARDDPCEPLAGALAEAVQEGNGAIFADAGANPERHGMGTTVTAAVVCGGAAHLAHVGDSRAYLLRPSEGLHQLTVDHTPVAEAVAAGFLSREEAASHPERNLLSRVVGLEPAVEVDTYRPVALEAGDRLLLCSDGLTAVLTDEALARLLADLEDPRVACEELIRATLGGGAPDNVTVVVGIVRGA
jgi:PPM family protein phosphatase